MTMDNQSSNAVIRERAEAEGPAPVDRPCAALDS